MERAPGDPRAAKVVRLPPGAAAAVAAELARTLRPNHHEGERRGDPLRRVAETIAWDPRQWPQGQVGDLTVHEFLTDLDALTSLLATPPPGNDTAGRPRGEATTAHYEKALAVLLCSTAADDPVVSALEQLRRASTHPFHGPVTATRWQEDTERRAPQVRAAWRALKDAVAEDPRLAD